MQLSEFYSEIGQALNDPNHDRWSQSILLPRINEGMTDLLVHTNAVKTREDLTPVVSNEEVQLDTDTIDIIRVHIKNSDGKWKKLDGILVDQLDYMNPNWQQLDDGEPDVYWWDGTNQKIHLVPKPSSTWAQTDGLRVWEVQKPTALSSSTDVPYSSNAALIPYHRAIVHYVVGLCWMDDGTPEALAKSRFHKSNDFSRPGEYEREIKKIWKRFDSPEDIPSRILWRPEGGRASQFGITDKTNPLNA